MPLGTASPETPSSTVFSRYAMRFVAEERQSETSLSSCSARRSMPDPNLPLLEDAIHKIAPFPDEIVFVGNTGVRFKIQAGDPC